MIKPGVLSLVQDAGRLGFHHLGLTTGGPLDSLAFRWVNRLCQNPLTAAALEISVGGLELEAQVDSCFSVTGASLPLAINGRERELWRSHRVKAGDRVTLGFARLGMRAYLAVAGGFAVAPEFGSVATVCREGVGGLGGGPLAAGDVLRITHETDSVEPSHCLRLPGSRAACL